MVFVSALLQAASCLVCDKALRPVFDDIKGGKTGEWGTKKEGKWVNETQRGGPAVHILLQRRICLFLCLYGARRMPPLFCFLLSRSVKKQRGRKDRKKDAQKDSRLCSALHSNSRSARAKKAKKQERLLKKECRGAQIMCEREERRPPYVLAPSSTCVTRRLRALALSSRLSLFRPASLSSRLLHLSLHRTHSLHRPLPGP